MMKIKRVSVEGTNLLSIIDLVKEEFKKTIIEYDDYVYSPSDDIYILTTERLFVGAYCLVVIILDFRETDKCNIEIIVGGGDTVPIIIKSDKVIMKKIIKILDNICKENSWNLKQHI